MSGSSKVSNDALKRACYTVRFLFADHSGIRATFYKFGGRFAVMSATEVTLDIPEHSHMDPWWNKRARGLGGSFKVPIVTGAEENLLCWPYVSFRISRSNSSLSSGQASLSYVGLTVCADSQTPFRQVLYSRLISFSKASNLLPPSLWHILLSVNMISCARAYMCVSVSLYEAMR